MDHGDTIMLFAFTLGYWAPTLFLPNRWHPLLTLLISLVFGVTMSAISRLAMTSLA